MKKIRRPWPFVALSLVVLLVCLWFWKDRALAPTQFFKQSKTSKVASFNKKQYSINDPNSIWVVVNKQRRLQPANFVPANLTFVGNGQMMRDVAAKALTAMFTESSLQGLPMQAASGYRSYQTQVVVYGQEVRQNGLAIADSESARPGYSEHQTGLAIDVSGGGCIIADCFGSTKQGAWLANNAYRYGFIIRYPEGKTAITGYRYEPWHIRYIGVTLATEMHKQQIETLEEFFKLPAAPTY